MINFTHWGNPDTIYLMYFVLGIIGLMILDCILENKSLRTKNYRFFILYCFYFLLTLLSIIIYITF